MTHAETGRGDLNATCSESLVSQGKRVDSLGAIIYPDHCQYPNARQAPCPSGS